LLSLPVTDVEVDDGSVVPSQASKQKNHGKVTFAEICQKHLYQKNQFQIQATASHVSPKSPPPFAAHFVEIEVRHFYGYHQEVLSLRSKLSIVDSDQSDIRRRTAQGAIVNRDRPTRSLKLYSRRKGFYSTIRLGKYGIAHRARIPPITVKLVDSYEESGPFGAKSFSEININGALPAICNAFYNATGKRLFRAPFIRCTFSLCYRKVIIIRRDGEK